jgi:hypothetical protein
MGQTFQLRITAGAWKVRMARGENLLDQIGSSGEANFNSRQSNCVRSCSASKTAARAPSNRRSSRERTLPVTVVVDATVIVQVLENLLQRGKVLAARTEHFCSVNQITRGRSVRGAG